MAFTLWKKKPTEDEIREVLARAALGDWSVDELRDLADKAGENFESVLVAMIEAVSGSARESLSEIANQLDFVQSWQESFRQGATEDRIGSLRRLALALTPATIETLTAAMEDDDRAIRIEACRTLVESGAFGGIEHVVGQIPGNQASRLLMDLARDESSPQIAEAAAQVLYGLGKVEALRTIVRSGGPGAAIAEETLRRSESLEIEIDVAIVDVDNQTD